MLEFTAIAGLFAAHTGIEHLRVAYSGGADSHVLLHLLAQHREALPGRALSAVYVDHNLDPASAAWGEHCLRICRELDVGWQLLRVDATPVAGESPEEAARRARYRALGDSLGAHDALLTAHHRDDQAETLLLQLLRGCGPQGLAAMAQATPLAAGWLLRPLLHTDRQDILEYAGRHRLAWIEDASNRDLRLNRNYLRHAVLPLLRERWPGAARTLARSAELCADAQALLDELADRDLQALRTAQADRLSLAGLLALEPRRQRNALRRWFRRLGLASPQRAQLERLIASLGAPPDRQPRGAWPGVEVRRYGDALYAFPQLPLHDPHQVLQWSGEAPLSIGGIGTLRLIRARGGLKPDCLRRLSVRFRRGGERLRVAGAEHRRPLKKLLQEAAIPPWQRERIPLLYSDERLIAVADLWIAADCQASHDESGKWLEWLKTP